MKKRILFVMPGLYGGGAEKSLVNLLNILDYSKVNVDLLLFRKEGLFLNQVPAEVNILETPLDLKYCYSPIEKEALKNISAVKASITRLVGTLICRLLFKEDMRQKRWKYFYSRVIKELNLNYDVAVAYLHGETSYYVIDKIGANKKLLWVHNDFDKIEGDNLFFQNYFEKADCVVSISEQCVNILRKTFPQIRDKFHVLPNLTSALLIHKMANMFVPAEYTEGTPIILSIGRLNYQKGFDYAIDAAAILKKSGYNFKWFILGIGELQQDLEERIKNNAVEDCFKLLGIRENPYPYIRNCTLIVQSSRFEGKSVVIDEAKILAKPIVVTNYPTVKDQIINGTEGLIVGINAASIAQGIMKMLDSQQLCNGFTEYLEKHNYDNSTQISSYMELFGIS